MGIDGIEFIMDVESEFGIRLHGDACYEIHTIGEFVQYIEYMINRASVGVCPTSRVFYDLRREVRLVLDDPDMRIAPAMSLAAAIPLSQRRRVWNHLEKCGLAAWPLRLPWWISRPALAGLLVVTLLTIAAAAATGLWVAAAVFIGFTLIFAIMIAGVLEPARVSFPAGRLRVRDLVYALASPIRGRVPRTSRNEIRMRIITIAARQFGVDESAINDSTRFIQDLGA